MEIINKKPLEHFKKRHPQGRQALIRWENIVSKTNYRSFHEIKITFPSVDYCKPYTIFDIGGNKYRLITRINYEAKLVLIKCIWTHAEYSKNQKLLTEAKL